MSHSTLNDFYKGMKMPKYDGQNVLNQLQQLQGEQTQVQQEMNKQVTTTKYQNNQSFGR
jgi:hypothetical protein